MSIVPHFLFTAAKFAVFLVLLSSCSQDPIAWWKKVNHKAAVMAEAEAKYEALKIAHEQLREAHLRLEQEYMNLRAQVDSKELAKLSLNATGSVAGRAPASIRYEIPKGLAPAEMRALAFEHFRENRFGESAVTFDKYLELPETVAAHDASAMYSAGVAWFNVGNFHKAREDFESARTHVSSEQRGKIQKKVDLWIRVIDRKLAGEKQGG